jgi:hypothetical protein
MALGIGTPEVQQTISIDPEMAPISLDPVVLPKEPDKKQSAAKDLAPAESAADAVS